MASLLPPTSAELLQAQFDSSPHAVLTVSLIEIQEKRQQRQLQLGGSHGGAFKGQRTMVVKWWNPVAAETLGAEPYSSRVSIRGIMNTTSRLLSVLAPAVRSALLACLNDVVAGRNLQPLSFDAYGIQGQPCLFLEPCREVAPPIPLRRPTQSSRATVGFLQRCFRSRVTKYDEDDSDEGAGNKALASGAGTVLATLLLTFTTMKSVNRSAVHSPASPAASPPAAQFPLEAAFAEAATAQVAGLEGAAMDVACLAGLPVCVTVFTVAGQIRHQNEASVQYYGNRGFARIAGIGIGDSGDKPLTSGNARAVAAGPVDVVGAMNNSDDVSMAGAGTMGGRSCKPQAGHSGVLAAGGAGSGDPLQVLQIESCPCSLADSNVLGQLFIFDRGKLEQMMTCVLEAGQVWEGIVRVPDSLDSVRRSEKGLKSRSLSLSIPKWGYSINTIRSGEVLQVNMVKGSEAKANVNSNYISLSTDPAGSTPPSAMLPQPSQQQQQKQDDNQHDAEVRLELSASHLIIEASDMSRSLVPFSEPVPESAEVHSTASTTTIAVAARTSSGDGIGALYASGGDDLNVITARTKSLVQMPSPLCSGSHALQMELTLKDGAAIGDSISNDVGVGDGAGIILGAKGQRLTARESPVISATQATPLQNSDTLGLTQPKSSWQLPVGDAIASTVHTLHFTSSATVASTAGGAGAAGVVDTVRPPLMTANTTLFTASSRGPAAAPGISGGDPPSPPQPSTASARITFPKTKKKQVVMVDGYFQAAGSLPHMPTHTTGPFITCVDVGVGGHGSTGPASQQQRLLQPPKLLQHLQQYYNFRGVREAFRRRSNSVSIPHRQRLLDTGSVHKGGEQAAPETAATRSSSRSKISATVASSCATTATDCGEEIAGEGEAVLRQMSSLRLSAMLRSFSGAAGRKLQAAVMEYGVGRHGSIGFSAGRYGSRQQGCGGGGTLEGTVMSTVPPVQMGELMEAPGSPEMDQQQQQHQQQEQQLELSRRQLLAPLQQQQQTAAVRQGRQQQQQPTRASSSVLGYHKHGPKRFISTDPLATSTWQVLFEPGNNTSSFTHANLHGDCTVPICTANEMYLSDEDNNTDDNPLSNNSNSESQQQQHMTQEQQQQRQQQQEVGCLHEEGDVGSGAVMRGPSRVIERIRTMLYAASSPTETGETGCGGGHAVWRGQDTPPPPQQQQEQRQGRDHVFWRAGSGRPPCPVSCCESRELTSSPTLAYHQRQRGGETTEQRWSEEDKPSDKLQPLEVVAVRRRATTHRLTVPTTVGNSILAAVPPPQPKPLASSGEATADANVAIPKEEIHHRMVARSASARNLGTHNLYYTTRLHTSSSARRSQQQPPSAKSPISSQRCLQPQSSTEMPIATAASFTMRRPDGVGSIGSVGGTFYAAARASSITSNPSFASLNRAVSSMASPRVLQFANSLRGAPASHCAFTSAAASHGSLANTFATSSGGAAAGTIDAVKSTVARDGCSGWPRAALVNISTAGDMSSASKVGASETYMGKTTAGEAMSATANIAHKNGAAAAASVSCGGGELSEMFSAGDPPLMTSQSSTTTRGLTLCSTTQGLLQTREDQDVNLSYSTRTENYNQVGPDNKVAVSREGSVEPITAKISGGSARGGGDFIADAGNNSGGGNKQPLLSFDGMGSGGGGGGGLLSPSTMAQHDESVVTNPGAADMETPPPLHGAPPTGMAWHEVRATSIVSPTDGQRYLLLIQKDVTVKVEAERHIAKVSECEHRLLEQIFPRHVLAYMTQEGFSPEPPPPPVEEDQPPELSSLVDCATAVTHGSCAAGPSTGPSSRPSVLSLQTWRPYVRDYTRLATWHERVTVLFADIQGFTPMCRQLPPCVVMKFLNDLFVRFDAQLDMHGVYKVETIGDCYMVAGGLIREDHDGMAAVQGGDEIDPLQADKVFAFAQAMLRAASRVLLPNTGQAVKVRVGIHSGPVVSGVVGTRMPRFCLFGDTINTASRMESTGTPGAIHVSSDTYALLSDACKHTGWSASGGIEVKGKGMMETYLWTSSATGAAAVVQ